MASLPPPQKRDWFWQRIEWVEKACKGQSSCTGRAAMKLLDKEPLQCSRASCQRQNPVVKRWFSGVEQYPVLIVYLCEKCKDDPLWSEDVIKEERFEKSEM